MPNFSAALRTRARMARMNVNLTPSGREIVAGLILASLATSLKEDPFFVSRFWGFKKVFSVRSTTVYMHGEQLRDVSTTITGLEKHALCNRMSCTTTHIQLSPGLYPDQARHLCFR